MEWLAWDGRQLFGNVFDVVVNQDGSLVDGQLLAAGILSEATVIGHEVSQVLRTRLHA